MWLQCDPKNKRKKTIPKENSGLGKCCLLAVCRDSEESWPGRILGQNSVKFSILIPGAASAFRKLN